MNYSDLGAAAGVSSATAKEWVRILQSMGIVCLLEPYFANELKRMVKTPKLYFCDTGLCAFLSSWTSRDALMNGAAAGHFLENHVVGEFIRNGAYGSQALILNFYRDSNAKEIDLVIDAGGELHPFEVKKAASPERKAVKTFTLLERGERQVGPGGIICLAERPLPIDARSSLIPVGLL